MQIPIVTVILFITVTAGFLTNRPQTAKTNKRIARIANGEQLDVDNYPYVVGLIIGKFEDEVNHCTGTLVSPLFIITAAHCIVDRTSAQVIFLNLM